MKLNKKVIESMTVVSAVVVMSTFTALPGSTEESATVAETSIIVLEKTGTAGIIAELHKMEADAMVDSGLVVASIERAEDNFVAEGIAQETVEGTEVSNNAAGISQLVQNAIEDADIAEQLEAEIQLEEKIEVAEQLEARQSDEDIETVKELEARQIDEDIETAKEVEKVQPEEKVEATEKAAAVQPEESAEKEEAQPEAENEEWKDQVMANVEEEMNIRTAPDETSELAGKFYRGDVAEIIEVGDEWTEIVSGDVTGFVKNDYLVYGDDAYALANEVCSIYATVNTDGLRLRNAPSEEGGIITTAYTGDRLKVDKEAEEVDGWVAVKTSDSTAYVSADYVDVALNLGTALSIEEVIQREEAKAAAEAAAKAKKTSKKAAVAASVDEVTLLGALIQCEAGNCSYEGMVAVGAVVMNRVRSGAYPGSISAVIYQAGQFTPALNGSVANVAAGGVRSACLQAAQEAINGVDNTNGALQFRSASSGYAGTVIGGNVFF